MRKNTKRRASSTIYIIFLLVLFLAFAAFAVDGTIVFTNRMKLQNVAEMTALAGASEFNYVTGALPAGIVLEVRQTATKTFQLLKSDSLQSAQILDVNDNDNDAGSDGIDDDVEVNTATKHVRINVRYISKPFFLSFLGVSGITLSAKACAVSEPLSVTANYGGINWVTPNAAYRSDILSKNVNMNDTAILNPLGNFYSASIDSGTKFVNFSLIDSENSQPLSLGPGGFITIKLPAPIIDKTGNDLYIAEAGGALEGYMVFAGIDKDPANPYVDAGKVGGGISWINMTGSGTSTMLANPFGVASTNLSTGPQAKFYGSGYFDIAKSGLSIVKYIRIIDDNAENGFMKNASDGQYYKTMLYGEASSATSGADIDAVNVLNHVKLIPASSY